MRQAKRKEKMLTFLYFQQCEMMYCRPAFAKKYFVSMYWKIIIGLNSISILLISAVFELFKNIKS